MMNVRITNNACMICTINATTVCDEKKWRDCILFIVCGRCRKFSLVSLSRIYRPIMRIHFSALVPELDLRNNIAYEILLE